MKDVRSWVVLLALVSFLAGSAAGVLVERFARPDQDRVRFADYSEWLIDEFDLSSERAGHLRVILREYEAEIERIERQHQATFFAALEPDLKPLGVEFNGYVRDRVLPPSQRARFDALVANLEKPSGAH